MVHVQCYTLGYTVPSLADSPMCLQAQVEYVGVTFTVEKSCRLYPC